MVARVALGVTAGVVARMCHPLSVSATTVTLQGKVDDGLPHSPIANAVCRFTDRNGTQLATATADTNGVFQLAAPTDVQGFIRCAPPALSNLGLSAFVSTAGRQAGDTIANLTVTPATTMVADILATTSPPDIQASATALTNALAAERRGPDLASRSRNDALQRPTGESAECRLQRWVRGWRRRGEQRERRRGP